MQPSIQHIFYQINDSCLYFPESSVIFIARVVEENKTKSVSNVNKVVGQKFTKNAKNGFKCLKLILKWNFCNF